MFCASLANQLMNICMINLSKDVINIFNKGSNSQTIK